MNTIPRCLKRQLEQTYQFADACEIPHNQLPTIVFFPSLRSATEFGLWSLRGHSADQVVGIFRNINARLKEDGLYGLPAQITRVKREIPQLQKAAKRRDKAIIDLSRRIAEVEAELQAVDPTDVANLAYLDATLIVLRKDLDDEKNKQREQTLERQIAEREAQLENLRQQQLNGVFKSINQYATEIEEYRISQGNLKRAKSVWDIVKDIWDILPKQ